VKESFIQKIRSPTPAIGTLVTLAAPEVAEILSLCGFDWLFIDAEHGAFSVAAVQHMVQATRDDCLAMVRVPENSSTWIKRMLDTGCDGLIVPQVNSAEEARRAVAAARYPPAGTRGVGVARAQGYGLSFADYVAAANDHVAVIIQIEHIDAVANLDSILAVEGIDGVLIGPYDLSGSMNRLGEVGSEPVQKAIGRIKKACIERAVPFGIFTLSAELAQKEIASGCSFIAVGTDAVFLWGAAKDALKTVLS
jgi:2-dehydro-3-deoxyglucarate aldolase/4-hydroxy-2-oxoheptanedioate aldolase